ncbi:MAG: tetratricopeptide repeat protein [Deltaproteobacteria bacterium]|nr:tetratricopeptide repeat protein [Deltaproteobacteria bacterium]
MGHLFTNGFLFQGKALQSVQYATADVYTKGINSAVALAVASETLRRSDAVRHPAVEKFVDAVDTFLDHLDPNDQTHALDYLDHVVNSRLADVPDTLWQMAFTPAFHAGSSFNQGFARFATRAPQTAQNQGLTYKLAEIHGGKPTPTALATAAQQALETRLPDKLPGKRKTMRAIPHDVRVDVQNLIKQARSCLKVDNPERAVALLEDAHEIALKKNQKNNAAAADEALGELYELLALRDGGRSAILAAQHYARASTAGRWAQVMERLEAEARMWENAGFLEHAADATDRLCLVLEGFGYKFEAAMNYSAKGRIWLSLGDYTRAVNAFIEAIKIHETIKPKDLFNLAVAENELGQALAAVGNEQLAVSRFIKAFNYFLELARNKNQPRDYACSLAMNAIHVITPALEILLKLGDGEKAVALLAQAMEVYSITGNTLAAAQTIKSRAGLLLRLKRWEEAASDYEKAKEYYLQNHDHDNAFACAMDQINMLLAAKKPGSAMHVLKDIVKSCPDLEKNPALRTQIKKISKKIEGNFLKAN